MTATTNTKMREENDCARKIENTINDRKRRVQYALYRGGVKFRGVTTCLCESFIVKYRQVSNELSLHTLRKLFARVPSLPHCSPNRVWWTVINVSFLPNILGRPTRMVSPIVFAVVTVEKNPCYETRHIAVLTFHFA